MSSSNVFGDASQWQPPAAKQQLNYDLRPLSTGEILDRTFQIYRSRFALFAGLALLPAAVSVVTSALRLLYASHQDIHVQAGAGFYRAQIFSAVLSLISGLISVVLYGITQAASTWAVSAVYLGEPASIKAAYTVAFRHWFRYTLIVLRQTWAFMWLPLALLVVGAGISVATRPHRGSAGVLVLSIFGLAFVSVIYGFWAYLRISLAVPAAVVESLKIGPAVRRAAQLLASRKVRVFLLFLLLLALYMVVGAIESPFLLMAARSRGTQAFVTQGINLAVSFVAGTLIGPVGAIGLCLFYFDERVRREGFDIEWMMKKLAPSSGSEVGFSVSPQGSTAEPA